MKNRTLSPRVLIALLVVALVTGMVIWVQLMQRAEGVWQSLSPLPEARANHGIVVLSDGRALIAGGEGQPNPVPAVMASSALLDPESLTWSAAGELNVARQGAPLTLLASGEALVAGGAIPGESHHEALSSSELFDPTTNTWRATGDLQVPRYRAAYSLLSDGRVLAVSGSNGPPDGERFQASAEIYEPRSGTWRLLEEQPTVARDSHWAVTLPGGRVLVSGGEGPWMETSTVTELFDPDVESFTPAGNMNVPRRFPSVTLLADGRVIVVGGWDALETGGRIYYSSAEIYDPITGSWTLTEAMHGPRAFQAAALLPTGEVMVAGGQNNDGHLSTTEIYDPETNTWREAGDMPEAVRMITTTAAMVPGIGMLVTGGIGQDPSSGDPVISDATQLYRVAPLGHGE